MNIYSLEKFKRNLEWNFFFMKKCENLILGEHLLLGRYLKHENGYTRFLKKSLCNNIYYTAKI